MNECMNIYDSNWEGSDSPGRVTKRPGPGNYKRSGSRAGNGHSLKLSGRIPDGMQQPRRTNKERTFSDNHTSQFNFCTPVPVCLSVCLSVCLVRLSVPCSYAIYFVINSLIYPAIHSSIYLMRFQLS